MTEEEILRAFYLQGVMQGLLQGYAINHDLKHSQDTLDNIQNSFIPVMELMKEGATAIRDLRQIKEHPGYNIAMNKKDDNL